MTPRPPEALEASLRRHWADSLARSGVVDRTGVLPDLLQRWREPHRAYHTCQHLHETLQGLQAWRPPFGSGPLALALFFHDAVYDPRRADNEEASAQLAREALGALGLDAPTLLTVGRLIAVTRHAKRPEGEDEKWMVDLDLSILGASPARYAQYRTQVRQEYAHVPDPDFRRGRLALVERFLAQGGALFHTEPGRAACAAAALRNLGAEAQELREGPGAASGGCE